MATDLVRTNHVMSAADRTLATLRSKCRWVRANSGHESASIQIGPYSSDLAVEGRRHPDVLSHPSDLRKRASSSEERRVELSEPARQSWSNPEKVVRSQDSHLPSPRSHSSLWMNEVLGSVSTPGSNSCGNISRENPNVDFGSSISRSQSYAV